MDLHFSLLQVRLMNEPSGNDVFKTCILTIEPRSAEEALEGHDFFVFIDESCSYESVHTKLQQVKISRLVRFVTH